MARLACPSASSKGVPGVEGRERSRRGGACGWVWRRFFRRQASAVRAFSLNEFDGFREIGNESGGLPARYLGNLKFLLSRGESPVEGTLQVPTVVCLPTAARAHGVAMSRETSEVGCLGRHGMLRFSILPQIGIFSTKFLYVKRYKGEAGNRDTCQNCSDSWRKSRNRSIRSSMTTVI